VRAHAQDPPQFRSGVEVTSVDVTVVDGNGRPIADLEPGDFTVRVDGVPRRIVSAEWINLGAGARSSSFTTDRNEVKRILSTSIGGVPYPLRAGHLPTSVFFVSSRLRGCILRGHPHDRFRRAGRSVARRTP